MTVEIRPVAAEQVEAFQRSMGVPFNFDPGPDRFARFQDTFELNRLRAAFDGDEIVGTFGALSLQLAVPGNVLPAARTTVVTVLPTHRRQGVLRMLMNDHLAEVRRNGEPLAALWASESSIYDRFGYGPASERVAMKIEKPYARLREPVDLRGTMRLVERDEAQQLFPAIYEAVVSKRPGMIARTENWWSHRVLSDPEFMRRGATCHRRVLHVRDGRPVGYVIYRSRTEPDQGTAEIRVVELIGIDAAAEKALWQFLCGIDLVSSISHWNQPIDDPLRWWLHEPRRMERRVEDSLWLRLVDVGTALAQRRYSRSGTLALQVRDSVCPWNEAVWRLDVDDQGVARCRQSDGQADVELTAAALGMVYLGGHRCAALARSGLVNGSSAGLRLADEMFTWEPLPWCPELF